MLVFVLFLILKCSIAQKRREEPDNKKLKSKNRLYFWGMIISAWYFTACVINRISGGLTGIHVEVELFSPRITLFGISFSYSNVLMWIITAVILVLCLIFRFVIFPRFTQENPKGIQNVIELMIEAVDGFVKGAVGEHVKGNLPSYMLSVALFMIGSALCELFGQRPPTADLIVTLSMGLCTFFLINYYAIRVKGVKGRIKSGKSV